MAIVKQAWTSREPFDHEGPHYRFADFVSDMFPVQQPRPRVSFGGSSPAAYQAGGAEADIYCLWGEPLASTAEQIESVKAAAPGGRAHGHAQDPGGVPADHRADRGEGLGEGTRHRRAGSRRGSRRAAAALPAPADQEPGEHRVAAAAGHRRGGREVRPGAVDPHRGRHRRRGQLQRARRHAGNRGRRRSWTTSTWAWTSSPCAATTCSPTPSRSASRSSRSSARGSQARRGAGAEKRGR